MANLYSNALSCFWVFHSSAPASGFYHNISALFFPVCSNAICLGHLSRRSRTARVAPLRRATLTTGHERGKRANFVTQPSSGKSLIQNWQALQLKIPLAVSGNWDSVFGSPQQACGFRCHPVRDIHQKAAEQDHCAMSSCILREPTETNSAVEGTPHTGKGTPSTVLAFRANACNEIGSFALY